MKRRRWDSNLGPQTSFIFILHSFIHSIYYYYYYYCYFIYIDLLLFIINYYYFI